MASLAEQKEHTLRLVGKVDELAGGLGDMEVRRGGVHCDGGTAALLTLPRRGLHVPFTGAWAIKRRCTFYGVCMYLLQRTAQKASKRAYDPRPSPSPPLSAFNPSSPL